MNMKIAGAMIAALGLLSLSWQCYLLSVISCLEMTAMGMAYTPTDLASRPTVLLTMLLQWFELYHRIAIHDLSAVEDTILAPVVGSVVLVAVSAVRNILAYRKYTTQ